MDATVKNLLKQWGFADFVEVFASKEIDFHSFLLLKPGSKNIETLIPKMGKRIKFEENLEKFHISNYKTKLICDDKDIEKFLKETVTGFIILNHYKKYGQLNSQIRRKLADIIMTHLSIAIIKKPYPLKLKNIHIKELAFKVSVYFKEKMEIYYVPPLYEGKHQKMSKGIFIDRYRNNRRDCMTSGLIINVRSTESNSTTVSPVNEAVYEMNTECLKLCESHIQWLKHNREPWSNVVEHWDASRGARIKDMATWDGNVHLLFTKWPILKQPQGYTLIESDYAVQFGNVLCSLKYFRCI